MIKSWLTSATLCNSMSMNSELFDLRIGSLLVGFDLLDVEQVSQAITASAELQLPLGTVLVMFDFISEASLRATIRAQSMLKDELITMDIASKAIWIAHTEGCSFDRALLKTGWAADSLEVSRNRLGELLVNAGVITQQQLDGALALTEGTALPLGRVLLATGALAETTLNVALDLQRELREGAIERDRALERLTTAEERRQNIELVLQSKSGKHSLMRGTCVRLGQLFVEAGLLREEDVINAVEMGLSYDKQIGQVLTDLGWIEDQLLEAALVLHPKVKLGQITLKQAAHVLSLMHKDKLDYELAMRRMILRKPDGSPLVDFLKLTGTVKQRDIDEAIKRNLRNPERLKELLNYGGVGQNDALDLACRVNALVHEGVLGLDQAMIALEYCRKNDVSIDEAIKRLSLR